MQAPPLAGVARNGLYKCGGVEILPTSAGTFMLSGLSARGVPVTGFMELAPATARALALELLTLTKKEGVKEGGEI